MIEPYPFKEDEFEAHIRKVFEPHHFSGRDFLFSKDALKHGLDSLSYDSFELELTLRDEAPYFMGKYSIQETLRKMQAVASVMSIALETDNL